MIVLNGKAHLTLCTWEQVPHLSPEVQEELLATYPAYQRDARSKVIAALGCGVGNPAAGSSSTCRLAESHSALPDSEIHPDWPRAYGLDVGWNRTAAVLGALN